MKKRLIIYLSLCLVVASFTVFAQGFFVIKSNNTKLMDRPQGKDMTTLSEGTEVKVIESSGKWSKIQVEGWVLTDSIVDLTASEEEPIIKTDIADNKNDNNKPEKKATKEKKNQAKKSEVTNSSFIYDKIKITRSFGYTRVQGKITNYAGVYLKEAKFKITLYDSNNNLIGTGYSTIKKLSANETQSFVTSINCDPMEVKNYKIEFQK